MARRCWPIRVDRAAYSRLCQMLTKGKAAAGKGACFLDWERCGGAWRGACWQSCCRASSDDTTQANLKRLVRKHSATAPIMALTLRIAGPAMRCRLQAFGRTRSRRARSQRSSPAMCCIIRPRSPNAAGRDELHPRGLHDRRCRPSFGALCRPSSAHPGGDGAAVCRLSRRHRPHDRDHVQRCRFLPCRICATNIRTKRSCRVRPRNRRWNAIPGPALPVALSRRCMPPEVEKTTQIRTRP